MKTSQLNKRAQRAMMRRHRGTAGLAWSCDPKRQVVHVAIHDGAMNGSALTFAADQFVSLITGLLSVEIDTLPLTLTRTYTPKTGAARDARASEAEAMRRNPEMTPEFIDRSAKAILRKYRVQKGGAS